MAVPTFPTITEQVATYLREEILRGHWSGEMPGQKQLAKLLGVSGQTIELALGQLEKDGLLVGQGTGRRRRIVLPENPPSRALRVALLLFDSRDRAEDSIIELQHRIEAAGHVPFFPDKTLLDLGMDAGRVARFVKKTDAGAWVVCAGSREVLSGFIDQETPAIALFGRSSRLPIASVRVDKPPAIAEATRQLIALGHRRISFLCRRQLRQPQPAKALRAFLAELEAAGIATAAFNLPDWEENREGIALILDSLFGGPTPPTALFVDEPLLFHPTYHHLARRGLRVPEDVSLICTDGDPDFEWCKPSVAHIGWNYRPLVRRIVRWVNSVSAGKDDRRQSLTKAEYVDGGTVGRAPS